MATKKYCDLSNWLEESLSGSCSGSASDLCGYENTQTNVLCKEFYLKDCENPFPLQLVDCSDLCDNDSQYYYIVDENDVFLPLQFNFYNKIETGDLVNYGWNIGSPMNYLCEIRAINCCNDNDYVDNDTFINADKHFVGKVEQTVYGGSIYKDIQQVAVTINNIPFNCFYLRIRVYENLARSIYTDYYTMPFMKIDCRHKHYHSIESSFTDYDNIGYYYDEPSDYTGTYFTFSNKMIFEGEFIKIGYDKNQTIVNYMDVTETQMVAQYRFRFNEMPEQAIDFLANILNGYDLLIDGEQYILNSGIEKNFDEGMDWYAEVLFTKYKDKISLSCK